MPSQGVLLAGGPLPGALPPGVQSPLRRSFANLNFPGAFVVKSPTRLATAGGSNNTHSKVPTYLQYGRVLRCGFILILVMCGLATWASVKYWKDNRIAKLEAYSELKNAYKYFDANRNSPGIYSVLVIGKNQVCAPPNTPSNDWSSYNSLFQWPGSKKGYQKAGKFYTGEPADQSAANRVIPAQKPFSAGFWKGARFCVKTVNPSTLYTLEEALYRMYRFT